jgi:hypothetical protein
MADPFDVDQRLDIVEILIRSVLNQENEELNARLRTYRSDNVQWVLNMVADMFYELQDSLELESYNSQDY